MVFKSHLCYCNVDIVMRELYLLSFPVKGEKLVHRQISWQQYGTLHYYLTHDFHGVWDFLLPNKIIITVMVCSLVVLSVLTEHNGLLVQKLKILVELFLHQICGKVDSINVE